MTKTLAITGANGFVGKALVEYFSQTGYKVIALVRDPKSQTARANVTFRKYDLASSPNKELLDNVDYLVHTAYVKSDRNHPDSLALNIIGAKKLLAAAHAARVKKCIFISSLSAHEAAISTYGRQKLAIEKLFTKQNGLSLRCGLIIGKGGIVKSMIDFMRKFHVVPLVDGGNQPLQIISILDLPPVIENATTKDLSGVLTVANPTVYTYREFYIILSNKTRARVFLVPIPYWLLMFVFKLTDALKLQLSLGKDSLLGLKMLRSVNNQADMKKVEIEPMDLAEALNKSGLG